ncbi:MAG: cytochrome c [Chloroflexota bacterium]|nr:cytochrome c [Chloroflexota bacterium]
MSARSRRSLHIKVGLLFLLACLLMAGCQGDDGSGSNGSQREGTTPETSRAIMAQNGEELFNAKCSACHGLEAAGTDLGPTLIHRVYHPGHHPDTSFHNAVKVGVRQHHWTFGNMAPVAGLNEPEVDSIICYVRGLQRENGLFEGDDFPTVC